MDLIITTIVALIEEADLQKQRLLCLGFCEHFVYAANVAFGSEQLSEVLGKLWHWSLKEESLNPQFAVSLLMEALPEMDANSEYDLNNDITVTSALLVEQAYKTLGGVSPMAKQVFLTSCDLITAYAQLLGVAMKGGKPFVDDVQSYPPFCSDYLEHVKRMVRSLPAEDNLGLLGEWRIDQRQWGMSLRDRVEGMKESND